MRTWRQKSSSEEAPAEFYRSSNLPKQPTRKQKQTRAITLQYWRKEITSRNRVQAVERFDNRFIYVNLWQHRSPNLRNKTKFLEKFLLL